MAVVLPNKRLILIPKPEPNDFGIIDSIFVTKTISLPDGDVIALRHCADSMRILKNMGINVDGCELFHHYYRQPTHPDGYRPWWWQLETANFLASNPRSFCTSTPRTGKTLSTTLAIDFLQQHGASAALIVAPLTVAAEGEWARTAREWFPSKKVVLIHKDREADLDIPAHIYLINPDGLKIVADRLAKKVIDGQISIVVLDELTEFANPKSQRWVAANKVCRDAKYVWGLTGTPGGPEKVYGQVKLVNPTKVPKFFGKWRDMTMYKATQFKWLPKDGHEDTIKEAMSPCIRYDKKDLMDIPLPQVITEEVGLSAEQEKLTKKLIDELQASVANNTIDAVTASALATKLLQVSAGVVRGHDGITEIDAAAKLQKLEEYLRRTPAKKVVFCNFTAVNDMLVREIRQMGFSCEKVDGSVTGLRRSHILKDFLETPEPHVLVCHPRTTAFGVELASADHIICYGPPMSGAFMYQQMFERLSSARQKADETFVVHIAAGKQDKVSFSNLARGVDIEQNIVDIFTRELLSE